MTTVSTAGLTARVRTGLTASLTSGLTTWFDRWFDYRFDRQFDRWFGQVVRLLRPGGLFVSVSDVAHPDAAPVREFLQCATRPPPPPPLLP